MSWNCRHRARGDGRGSEGREPGREGHGERAVAGAIDVDEVLEACAGLEEVEEVLEALLALEVQFRVVCPDVLAHLEHDEEVEHAHLALRISRRRGGRDR